MKRFSLANLLLFATIVALATALFITSSQLAKARIELSTLRNEMRVLDPSETDKMRAINVPAFGRNQWRWRIKLPENEKFVLRWAFDNIPADDSLPKNIDETYNPPMFFAPELPNDEFLLSIGALEEDGNWLLGVKTESVRGIGDMDFATEMKANDSSWLAKRGGNSIHKLTGQRKTEVNPIDSAFVLLRYRKGLSPTPGVSSMDPNPTDGILIWIERVTDPEQGRTNQ